MPAVVTTSRSRATFDLSQEKLYAYLIVDDIEIDDELIEKAKNGDGLSLSKIADIYYRRGDFQKAMHWYILSASQNFAFAQYKIGLIYQYGRGVYVNYKRAMIWYRKAHRNGHAAATNNIGTLYGKGQGVEQDSSLAFQWYSEAARNGSIGAHYNLGLHYENGLGVQKDMLYALEMYERSADQGHHKACLSIDRLNKEGIYIGEEQMKRFDHMKKVMKEKSDQVKILSEYNQSTNEKLFTELGKNRDLVDEINQLNTQVSYYKGQSYEFEQLRQQVNEHKELIKKHDELGIKHNGLKEQRKSIEKKNRELEQKNRHLEDQIKTLNEEILGLKSTRHGANYGEEFSMLNERLI